MQNYPENQSENFSPLTQNEYSEVPALRPSPDNPPWNSLTALLSWIGSVFFLLLCTNIFVGIYLFNQNLPLSDAKTVQDFITTDPTALLIQVASVVPAHILTLILAWAVITRLGKYSFKEMIGWKWGGFKFIYIIGIVVGFYVLAGLLGWLFGEQEHELTRILKSSRNAVYIVAFMATFTAPLVEEAIYRGILYPAFQQSFGIPLAVITVTGLFAGVHFIQYWNSPVALVLITLLSLVLTLIRVKTGNLLPCIVLHTIFNGIQSILLLIEPYINKG